MWRRSLIRLVDPQTVRSGHCAWCRVQSNAHPDTAMSRTLQALLMFLFLSLLSIPSATPVDAARVATSEMQTVGNITIYLGLLPAEMIRGQTQDHPVDTMHGGVPSGSGEYHILVALFDAKTGERITNAEVRARVSEVGIAGEEKKLEPMELAGRTSYGNYFPMAGSGPFRIRLTMRVPGEHREITAEFEHRHQ